ncbi:hypothetical protein [Sphingomonas sp.]|uniref:hypothetical protein n=1 Tax=Sphingomonas sp. TaxID=28214 RepID=UPI003AFFC11C
MPVHSRQLHSFVIGLVVTLAITSVACAQQKRPPQTVGGTGAAAGVAGGRKADPLTDDEAIRRRRAELTPEKIAAFKAAYKAHGKLRMLFLIGLDRRATGGAAVEGAGGVGKNIADFDPTAITEVLSADIQALISDDRSVRIVDLESLDEDRRRDAKRLAQNDVNFDTADLRPVADEVVYIKFTPLTGEARGQNNYKYRCVAYLKDLNSNSPQSLGGFDWDGEITSDVAHTYAAVLSAVLCDSYAKAVSNMAGQTDLTISVRQLPDGAASQLRKVLRGLDGVGDSVEMNTTTTADGGTEATFTTQLETGTDSADLQDALIAAAKAKHINLRSIHQGKNALTLVAGPGGDAAAGAPAAPDWYQLTDANDNPVKARFAAAYAKNPVKVAVTVNWLVSPEQMGSRQQRRLPLIVMQDDPRLANLPLGPQTEAVQRLSTDVVAVFKDLNVHVVSPAKVMAIAADRADKATELTKAQDLDTVLRSAGACDYLCLGLVTQVGQSDDAMPFTFNLTNCNNGDLDGALSWPVDLRVLKQVPQNRRLLLKPENRTRYIAGQMLLAVERAIGGGQVMSVQVQHATGLPQVQQVADAVKTVEEVTTDGVRFDNGVGTFTIRYSGAYEDLSPRVSSVVETLRPVHVTEINPSTLVVAGQ